MAIDDEGNEVEVDSTWKDAKERNSEKSVQARKKNDEMEEIEKGPNAPCLHEDGC